ncbi:cytochrome P450 [Trametes versicolor FP-101664 SS1]|uniref:cytochrome P450 n=1 Tax=Trametes versicolor (strain FP-101664) TaxID=717944 RepID=UPI0004623EF7|nr:cytochrome P450 [Trametes versicolor FP-101664 SS1]EIW58805.1 cytochrome P450 [Trametes versicolor FP-101664 SS1]
MSLTAWLLVFLSIGLLLVRRRRRRLALPPGPPGIPVVGNVLDFPQSHYGAKFAELAAKYGDLVYLELFGQPVVVVNSHDAAIDLLEKRSVNYSDRPRSVMSELTEYDDWVFVLMHYNQKWRQHRRVVVQSFQPGDALVSAQPIVIASVHELLEGLLRTPDKFSEHLGFTLAKSTIRLVYGIQLTDPNDRFFDMASTIVQIGSEMAVPGAFLVDVIPILRFLPSWCPGAKFLRTAEAWKLQARAYRDQLFAAGKAAFDRGIVDSLIGRVFEESDNMPPSETNAPGKMEEMLRGAAAAAYGGSADTTHAAAHVFFLAMALHKDVQEKAQSELDSVVGPDRLPTFADRESLPYIAALVKEVLRWHVIAPIGVAHRSVADDVYDGYLIPAGTLIVPNQWAMARDETQYPDPDNFRPERFLRNGKIDPNVRDPATFAFGFGRRICPGLHFVDMALFINFASILHVFNIGPPVDENDAVLPLKAEFAETSTNSRPEAFGCTIRPRSLNAAQLVHSLAEDAR